VHAFCHYFANGFLETRRARGFGEFFQ
jgi:hypothetical protein